MVHTFKCLGETFALDVESGSLFSLDSATEYIINAMNSPVEKAGEFSRIFNSAAEGGKACGEIGGLNEVAFSADALGGSDIKEIYSEINALIKEGVLFSPEPEHKAIKFDGAVKSICLNISHRCNLRCGYCFADGGSYCGTESDMSFETAKAAVDFLLKESKNRRNLEIDFFGGEPLLNLDIVKKTVAYARAKEKEFNKLFRFTVTTNALALTDSVTDFFNEEMFNVVISIDGRKSVHNSMRKTVGGGDSFDIVLNNALRFKNKRGDKQYFVRGTFTADNKDFAQDAVSLFDAGFDCISLEPVVLPHGNKLALKESDIETLKEQYEILAREYLNRKQRGENVQFFHFNIDLSAGPCETKRLKNCGAGCDYAAVVPSGKIYPCHRFAGNEEFCSGSVFETNRDKSRQQLFEKNTVLNKKACSECWAKYYCSGGCAANSIDLCGSMFSQDKLSCELMKKRTECALAIYSILNDV